jgi:hypothetical protein
VLAREACGQSPNAFVVVDVEGRETRPQPLGLELAHGTLAAPGVAGAQVHDPPFAERSAKTPHEREP